MKKQDMMIESEKKRMLEVAARWDGYLEKQVRDYSVYERKKTGAGLNNWTRFGRIADLVLYGIDRRVKDGYAWCAMFVMACLYETFAGAVDCSKPLLMVDEAARRRVVEIATCGGGDFRWHAGVGAWLSAFRHRYRTGKEPHPGDLVVFLRDGKAYHIGIVKDVFLDGTFRTIEGNTSAKAAVVEPNGGAVALNVRKNKNVEFLYL